MSSVSSEVQHKMEDVVDIITATSKLQLEAAEVRSARPNWKSYLQSQMIPKEDYDFISTYEASAGADKAELLSKGKLQCARTFLNLVTNLAKEATVKYVLTLLDDMLQEDRQRVHIFHLYAGKQKQSVWGPFLNMLNRQDPFIVNQVSRILTKLAVWGGEEERMRGADLSFYLGFLKDQLRAPGNEYIQTSARCLQMLLRLDEYREAFAEAEGLATLMSALTGRPNFQLQYQLVFCLWAATFNPAVAARVHRHALVPTLGDVLSESSKEKVIRIILATFRNLVEKPEEADVVRMNALQMVQGKVPKTLELLSAKTFDDQDLVDDMDFLSAKLQDYVSDLSSFDEYVTEVKSGRLEWSPVHKSEKFWRENATRFNENQFHLVKVLIELLETSKDPLVLCVAAHDLGEYVRHYPRGKSVMERLEGKTEVMKLLSHDDPNVRYSALLAVQKIMVHNSEYLAKQVPKDQAAAAKTATASA